MSGKHTSGPWAATPREDGGCDVVTRARGADSTRRWVAHADSQLVPEEREANAALMAAAPDLLEVVLDLTGPDGLPCAVSRLAFTPRLGCDCWACSWTSKALRAIAKAEGRA